MTSTDAAGGQPTHHARPDEGGATDRPAAGDGPNRGTDRTGRSGRTYRQGQTGQNEQTGQTGPAGQTGHAGQTGQTGLSRRAMLRGTGVLGAATAAAVGGITPAHADPADSTEPTAPAQPARGEPNSPDGLRWLVGDHHVHTLYSNDGKYRVVDHVRQARRYGIDWVVISDHGNIPHSEIGVVEVNPHIVAAREAFNDEILVYQGLEWNIPGAEHGTVFVHPGDGEVEFLADFEQRYDARVHGTRDGTPENEAAAVEAVHFLAQGVSEGRVQDVLFLANHPSRLGIDSPHEIRAWRDAEPHIAVGMEGAPGHQAGGLPAPHTSGMGRGLYHSSPGTYSFPDYPEESYRTWGGFDWMVATVGGVWDSLLAEGKPWWITATSDCHNVYTDTATRGPNSDYDRDGHHSEPVYSGTVDLEENDYWPGYYTRIHVGAEERSYQAVMDGIRRGRMWVDHGSLVDALSVRLVASRSADGPGRVATTLGGTLTVPSGTPVQLEVEIDLASGPNWAQFVPKLARVDVIRGAVTGPASDADTFTAPDTRVARSYDIDQDGGRVKLSYSLGRVRESAYVRLRGTDGNRSEPGFYGTDVDPHGPAIDEVGDSDPWVDLWFYTNPMWVMVEG